MLKPKGIKVLGTMAMVRNSVGGGNAKNFIIDYGNDYLLYIVKR